jgi:hypothetical protein
MILSKFAIVAWSTLRMLAASNDFDRFLDGNTVYIEQGNYLLHNEISLLQIEKAIASGRELLQKLESTSYSIPLVEELKQSSVKRLKTAVLTNENQMQLIVASGKEKSRTSRAIELFGDLLHAIAGTPTGAQWRENAKLVQHLKDAMSEQNTLDKSMVKSIKGNGRHILDLDNSALQVAHAMSELSSGLAGFAHLNKVVNVALDNQSLIKSKLLDIYLILMDGKEGRLSALLISNAELKVEIEELTGEVNQKGFYPIYGKDDLPFIYAMRNTITFIKDHKIHSVMAMPLIRLDEKLQAFTLEEPHFKLMGKQTPKVVLLETQGDFMAFVTQEQIPRCVLRKKNMFTCDIRVIKSYDLEPMCVRQWVCNNQEVPSTIIIETVDDKFLFISNKPLEGTISCDLGKKEQWKLGSKTALKVPKNCELITKTFTIEAYQDFVASRSSEFKAVEAEVPQLEVAPINGSLYFGALQSQVDRHRELINESNAKLQIAESKIETALSSSKTIEEIASGTTWHFLPGYISAGLAVVCFVAILFVALKLVKSLT